MAHQPGELATWRLGGVVWQALDCALAAPGLVLFLLVVWLYLGLTSREFLPPGMAEGASDPYMWTSYAESFLSSTSTVLLRTAGRGRGGFRVAYFSLIGVASSTACPGIGRKIRCATGRAAWWRRIRSLGTKTGAVLAWLALVLVTALCALAGLAGAGFCGAR